MEGKGCLFKEFCQHRCVRHPGWPNGRDKLIRIIMRPQAPRWRRSGRHQGARCNPIEQKLRERMGIPVFHDDRHGTAASSPLPAILNGLRCGGQRDRQVRSWCVRRRCCRHRLPGTLVRSGHQARERLRCVTREGGVIYVSQDEDGRPTKARFANKADFRTLADALVGRRCSGLAPPACSKPEMNSRP